MIRIFTITPTEDVIKSWSQFTNNKSSLEVSKEFKEKAFDGSSIFYVLELSTSFIVGVGSGMLANWLGSVLNERKTNKLKIGRKTFIIPSDDEIARAEIVLALREEIEELKQKYSEN